MLASPRRLSPAAAFSSPSREFLNESELAYHDQAMASFSGNHGEFEFHTYAAIGPSGEVVSWEGLRKMENLLTSYAERGGIREGCMGMGQHNQSRLRSCLERGVQVARTLCMVGCPPPAEVWQAFVYSSCTRNRQDRLPSSFAVAAAHTALSESVAGDHATESRNDFLNKLIASGKRSRKRIRDQAKHLLASSENLARTICQAIHLLSRHLES
jgi:hypothetical protein